MHAVIINGSPRTRIYSNTDKIIAEFVKGMEENSGTYELFSISDRNEWSSAKKAFSDNNNILIALPLFVECIPGLLMEFLEGVEKKDKDTTLSFILQSGFAEGIQLRCGEEFLIKLAERLGCTYGGTLVKGNNFGARFSEGSERDKITVPYREMGKIYAGNGNFFSGECRKFTGPEIFSLPIRILIGVLFKTAAKTMYDKVAADWGCTKPLDYRPYE